MPRPQPRVGIPATADGLIRGKRKRRYPDEIERSAV